MGDASVCELEISTRPYLLSDKRVSLNRVLEAGGEIIWAESKLLGGV